MKLPLLIGHSRGENVYKIIIGKHEGIISTGRTGDRWKGNLKTEIGREDVGLIHLIQNTVQW
jgi:hypothetical protein